ncbi:MAG: HD domain-containing protein [Pannonibacter sp.]|jgi:hypothetical protein
MRKTAMGTLTWSERAAPRDRGQTSTLEKGQLALNMIWTAALESGDWLRSQLGLMTPEAVDIDTLSPPDTQLVRDSLALAASVQPEALTEHCWRTYYYGVLLGQQRGLTFDRSLLFSAAMLHDVGLARDRRVAPGECCFAVSGGQRARGHLIACGHASDIADKVAEAITLHLNGYVSARRHGAVAHLVNRGAMCDVFGVARRRIATSTRETLAARHPVDGLVEALEIRTTRHLKGTRADLLVRLG